MWQKGIFKGYWDSKSIPEYSGESSVITGVFIKTSEEAERGREVIMEAGDGSDAREYREPWNANFLDEIFSHFLVLFSWTPKSLRMVAATMKSKDAYSLEEKPWQT